MADLVQNAVNRQPIAHAGGKLKITPDPSGAYLIGFSHTSSPRGGMALYQVAVSHSGVPLAVVPPTGMGAQHKPYPQPSILSFIISDSQQMWGRVCPQCLSYFRTNHVSGITHCPYCTFAHESIYFLTASQLKYLKKFVTTVLTAVKEQREIEIDLDEATDASEWTYAERELQHRFECHPCYAVTDILGEYGSCPSCGKRNSAPIFHRKLNEIETQIQTANSQKCADLLNRTVSIFEAMANDMKKILASIPCQSKRREQIARLNFQDIVSAVEQLDQWYAFDLCKGLNSQNLSFANLMFKRRHLFTHNEGRVDTQYLAETDDSRFELNEAVVLTSADISRIVPIVRKLGTNLITDVDSIDIE